MDETDANRRIAEFAHEASRRSRAPEPQRSEGRDELGSHLFEMARAHANGGPITLADAGAAIAGLGPWEAIEAAFFPTPAAREEVAWGPRLGAALIDYGIVVMGLSLVFWLAAPLACVGLGDGCRMDFDYIPYPEVEVHGGSPMANDARAEQRAEVLASLALVAFVFGPVLYWGLFEARWGATPGKMAMGLHVVGSDGGLVRAPQAFGRNATKALLPVPFMVPVLLVADVLWGRRPGSRGDRMFGRWTGTRVVHEAPAPTPTAEGRKAA